MILTQQSREREWFSWDTKTMLHYCPDRGSSMYSIIGPTPWDLKYNLKNGTTILGPDLLGVWKDD